MAVTERKQQGREPLKWTALVVASGLLCGLLALFGSMMFILSGATNRLTAYAAEFLQQDEKIAQNIDATLAAGNASTFAECSPEDLGLMRSLLFASPYLKDVGRVRNGALLCSAVAGALPHPVLRASAAATNYKGRKIFYNVELESAKGSKAEIVEDGRTNVVVSPTIFSDFSRPPMMFAGAIVNREQHKILQMYSSSTDAMPIEYLWSNMIMRKDSILYYPSCSETRPDCVLTGLPMKKVWAPNRLLMLASFAIGAAIGVAFASLVSLLKRRERSLASQLRRAVRKKQIHVVYQPILDLTTRKIVGCEALARWNDDEHKPVRPDIFIGLAEELGIVGEITTIMLERVIAELGSVFVVRPEFRCSVNLSAADLVDPTFCSRLDAMFGGKRFSARNIGLELTERSTADRNVVVSVIHELRERGHVMYIDDFGTGYSSLSYLHELAVDVLKIDRAFTNTIGTESVTASILPQILVLARTLELKVVVEGVETENQAAYLTSLGDDLQAQGWLFGKPMPVSELKKLLDA